MSQIDPSRYAADELLRDGGSIHVRAIRPDDKERLLEHFETAERALGLLPLLRRQAPPDRGRARPLHRARLRQQRRAGRDAARGRRGAHHRRRRAISAPATDPQRAEVAFAVRDDHQGRGIGTLLLEHLARIARAAGITEFEADVLGENNQMLSVFAAQRLPRRSARSTAACSTSRSRPRRPTTASTPASARERAGRGGERARACSQPRVGRGGRRVAHAGHDRRRAPREPARAGFTGRSIRSTRRPTRSQGLPRLSDASSAIGAPVDLASIAVPAPAVEAVVRGLRARRRARRRRDLGGLRRGVARGPRGRRRGCVDLVRGSGMRMVGPELHGRAQHRSRRSRSNATFAPDAGRRPATSACSRRAARSARDARLRRAASTSGSRRSSRSATRPTSRATICSPTGPTTRARA